VLGLVKLFATCDASNETEPAVRLAKLSRRSRAVEAVLSVPPVAKKMRPVLEVPFWIPPVVPVLNAPLEAVVTTVGEEPETVPVLEATAFQAAEAVVVELPAGFVAAATQEKLSE
jgi:hypothetical protein